MPLVRIEIYKGKSKEYKKAVMEGVHKALVTAFQIPEDDCNQRLFEHDPENFYRRSNKTDQIIIIEITAFKGRSNEAKKKLYAEITSNLAKFPGIVPSDILIYINEPPLENWGIQGKPGNEVDFGFKIEV